VVEKNMKKCGFVAKEMWKLKTLREKI